MLAVVTTSSRPGKQPLLSFAALLAADAAVALAMTVAATAGLCSGCLLCLLPMDCLLLAIDPLGTSRLLEVILLQAAATQLLSR